MGFLYWKDWILGGAFGADGIMKFFAFPPPLECKECVMPIAYLIVYSKYKNYIHKELLLS